MAFLRQWGRTLTLQGQYAVSLETLISVGMYEQKGFTHVLLQRSVNSAYRRAVNGV